MAKLSKYEREIEKEILTGASKPLSKSKKNDLLKKLESASRKITRINIRMPENDLVEIKNRASSEGIPYQTLIGSILHKYASGVMVDTTDLGKLKKILEEV